jgi:hypothetical protein
LTDGQCRDTNAGSFHVVLTNVVGLYQRSLAEDRTYNYEVWNQPIISYEVLKQDEVTATQANELLDTEGDTYQFNAEATKFYHLKTKVNYITESHPTKKNLIPEINRYTRTDTYEYILELDDDGNILGGEWIGKSRTDHPDFLWYPQSPGSGNPHVTIENVRLLLKLATEPEQPEEPEEPSETKEFKAEPGVDIPDNDPDTGVTSAIRVEDDFEVKTVKVAVNISHTFIGDLRVVLAHGDKMVVLHNGDGYDEQDLIEEFTLNDFKGLSAKGEWRLVVTDNLEADKGTLNEWSLKF